MDGIVRQAQQAMAAGRHDEAARLWEQVLAASPDHPQALLHLGQNALLRKNYAAARALLERAAKASVQNPVVPLNLSFVCRATGDAAGEMDALTRALTIDPYFFPALLAKAMLLERGGNLRMAARIYKDVLTIAPPEDSLTPDLVGPMRHARDVVRENAAALEKHLEQRLSAVRARHAGARLERFEECKDIAVGTKKAYTQQPSMLLVPGLPAIQFYDDREFPWLAELESATGAIREELLAVMKSGAGDFRPYVSHPDGAPLNQWKELNRSARWSTYFLWKDGKRFDEACARCPRTAAVSEAVPVIDAANFGPTIMFSFLAARTQIPAHSSVTNARLVVHLPLIVPPGCRFRVGNEIREWREGKAWVFDDTIEHEAWNDSDEDRVILMIDIWNPLLSAAERELVTALLNGVSDYYQEPFRGL